MTEYATVILMVTVLGDPEPQVFAPSAEAPTEDAVWVCHAELHARCGWYVEDDTGALVQHKDEDEHEEAP